MKLLHLKGTPIFEQLQLEEALLRTGEDNVCIINEGSSPAIVMGISGKADELIDLNKLSKTPIPVIKRYSGGGTVVVDESTVFVSFICNKSLVNFEPYPEPLMRWSAELYAKAWPTLDFSLRENDYVVGERKVGGNAQYLTKTRFVHHTTFLWDYQSLLMDLLLHPKKTPSYRAGRSHESFVAKLRDYCPDRNMLVNAFKEELGRSFGAKESPLEAFAQTLNSPHRKSTSIQPPANLHI